jgi:hypothetical protein
MNIIIKIIPQYDLDFISVTALLFHVKKDLTPNLDELGLLILFHIGENLTQTHISLCIV